MRNLISYKYFSSVVLKRNESLNLDNSRPPKTLNLINKQSLLPMIASIAWLAAFQSEANFSEVTTYKNLNNNYYYSYWSIKR